MKNILKNKPKRDVVAQLTSLKEWSQNPEAYYKKLKNSKYINNPKKLEAFVRSEDPVPRAKTQPKAVKVAGIKDTALYKTLKDPRVLGIDLGTDTIREIINLIQNSGLVKKPKIQPKKEKVADKQLIKFALEESPVPIVKKPEPTIPIEEKIRRFAQAKQNDTEQIGVESLLGIPKRFSR